MRHLCLGLRAAHRCENAADCLEVGFGIGGCLGGTTRNEVVARGPRCGVHRGVVPPAPHFFRDERNQWREQPLDHRQRTTQGDTCRCGVGGIDSFALVRALLDEFHVVVAEPPEKCLGAFERPCVVESDERLSAFIDHRCESVQHCNVNERRWCCVGCHFAEAENELRDVQQLHRELAADLHLFFAERGVDARTCACRPVTNGIAAVLVEQVDRRDDVALRLRHLLAVGVEDPARERGIRPGCDAVFEVRTHHGGEQPRADDFVRLRTNVHREDVREHRGVVEPAAGNLRRERTRCPRVHHVGVADESAGLTALRFGETRGNVGAGVDGQLIVGRNDGCVVVDRTIGVQRVPQRNRHAEVTLAADEPVAVQALDPVLVAVAHVVGMPREFVATLYETRAQIGFASAVADVPLARRDDFERTLALFEELHRVRDGTRLTDHLAAFAQQFNDRRLCLLHRLADDCGVVGAATFRRDGLGAIGENASVAGDDCPCGQLQFAPPGDVGDVAERTDHCDAGALVDLRQRMRKDRHFDVEKWCAHGRSEKWLIALVVGVRHECDTRGEKFGSRCVDENVAGTVGAVERQRVVGAGTFTVFELCLRHCGVEVDVPQRGGFLRIRLATGEVVEERTLADPAAAVFDGGVEE